jgi:hypothetical protein
MRQPQNGRPGVIGEHHGLTRLTTALETIEAGQRQQETRDTAIQTQLTTQAALLTQVVRWGRYQRWAIAGLGCSRWPLGGWWGGRSGTRQTCAMLKLSALSMPRSDSSGGICRERCRSRSGLPMAG